MDNLSATLDKLEKQEFHALLKHGLPEEMEKEIRALCVEYWGAYSESRKAMKSATARKGSAVIQMFSTRMATVAMQKKDKECLDLAVVAFDLGNTMEIDFRDAYGSIAQLAFAATECGVDLVSRAQAVIFDISPQLIEMLKQPLPPRLARDDDDNLVFRNPWSAKTQHKIPTP